VRRWDLTPLEVLLVTVLILVWTILVILVADLAG